MSKKYSYHCKSCGHTVLSDDKQEVKGARALHKKRTITGQDGILLTIPKCRLVPVDRVQFSRTPQTVARPVLAKILNERRA